jgi:hypothetical protein
MIHENGSQVYKSPLKVICPKCSAAVSAKCTEKKLDGSNWVNYFHFERIEKAKAEGFDAEKSA